MYKKLVQSRCDNELYEVRFNTYRNILKKAISKAKRMYYIDIFTQFKNNIDDIALVAPSLSSLKQMIQICEQFAESHSITFNPSKTKLLCFNMKLESKVPPIYLNGERVSIVENEKHLGNYVSTDIEDRNIIADVCDLYQRSNFLISDFRVCDSITLDSLHKIYCMHMYGSELWNLNCRYVDEFKVAW